MTTERSVYVHKDSIMRLQAHINGNMLANCEECGKAIPVELIRCDDCEAEHAQ